MSDIKTKALGIRKIMAAIMNIVAEGCRDDASLTDGEIRFIENMYDCLLIGKEEDDNV